jgi:hypothetical protein
MKSSKRSSRLAKNGSVAAVVLILISTACAHFGRRGGMLPPGDEPCAVLDSALASSGLRDRLDLKGKVTIDVNQYRVRGRFNLLLTREGDMVFEMNSTTLLGGHREDAVLSLHADTVRVLDRERGRLYQGEEVDALVEEGTDAAIDLRELLRRVLARPVGCARVSGLRRSGRSGGDFDGRLGGGDFELRFERGRLCGAKWPLPLSGGAPGERFDCTYSWVGGRLDAFVVHVRDSGWRIKLTDIEYKSLEPDGF